MIGLRELFRTARVIPQAIHGDLEIRALTSNSRAIRPGDAFVCMPSARTDSHNFLAAAHANGAVAAIVHSEEGFKTAQSLGLAVALINPRATCPAETLEGQIRAQMGGFTDALWRLADVAFGSPSAQLDVIGITGTNGKTTTAWLVRDALNQLGVAAGYLGTLGVDGPGLPLRELANTTPFSLELNAILAEQVSLGTRALAMEVSSHALSESRVGGIKFAVATFTNLTQDHLDYHGSMEAYAAAKHTLFTDYHPRAIALNIDDETGRLWSEGKPEAWTFARSRTHNPRVWAEDVNVSIDHVSMKLCEDGERESSVEAHLGGDYNASNLLAAAATLRAGGYGPLHRIADALSEARPVPGRFEPVVNDSGIGIIVDYAHTPDALEKLLNAARPLTTGRILTVFGCGGDRDRAKRPLMAAAAAAGSDALYVTSDNPRTEDPESILRDIEAGIPVDCEHFVEVDRPRAVQAAILAAQPGDTVIIAGKGHENYQIIGHEKQPMDDRKLARAGLEMRS